MKLHRLIMETEKSHSLPSASWSPWKAHSESKGLRAKGAGRKDRCSSSSYQAGKTEFFLHPSLFYSDPQWMDDAHPHRRKLAWLSPPIQMFMSSRNILTAHPEIMGFSQISGHPVIQSHWLIRLTIREAYRLRVVHFRRVQKVRIRYVSKGSHCPSNASQLGKTSSAQEPTESWCFWKIVIWLVHYQQPSELVWF